MCSYHLLYLSCLSKIWRLWDSVYFHMGIWWHFYVTEQYHKSVVRLIEGILLIRLTLCTIWPLFHFYGTPRVFDPSPWHLFFPLPCLNLHLIFENNMSNNELSTSFKNISFKIAFYIIDACYSELLSVNWWITGITVTNSLFLVSFDSSNLNVLSYF